MLDVHQIIAHTGSEVSLLSGGGGVRVVIACCRIIFISSSSADGYYPPTHITCMHVDRQPGGRFTSQPGMADQLPEAVFETAFQGCSVSAQVADT